MCMEVWTQVSLNLKVDAPKGRIAAATHALNSLTQRVHVREKLQAFRSRKVAQPFRSCDARQQKAVSR